MYLIGKEMGHWSLSITFIFWLFFNFLSSFFLLFSIIKNDISGLKIQIQNSNTEPNPARPFVLFDVRKL